MDYLIDLNWHPSRLTPVPDRHILAATTAEALRARTKARGLEGPDLRQRPKRPRPSMRQRP